MATKKTAEPAPLPHVHDWRVIGATIGDKVLLLECKVCKAQGSVEECSRVEYVQARHGNYDWKEPDRVTEIPNVL